MIVVWLSQLLVTVVEWFSGLFPASWTIPYPSGFTLVVPVPALTDVSNWNSWLGWCLAVGGALILGRFLMWLYRLIPFVG